MKEADEARSALKRLAESIPTEPTEEEQGQLLADATEAAGSILIGIWEELALIRDTLQTHERG